MLQLQLEQEREKRAPRTLTDDQKRTIIDTLRGKIPAVTFIVQEDQEAKYFALQLQIAIQEAGAQLWLVEPPAGELLPPFPGVAMHSPTGETEEQLKDDPLYLALKKANLFGGLVAQPFVSLKRLGLGPILPNDPYVIYVGPKLAW